MVLEEIAKGRETSVKGTKNMLLTGWKWPSKQAYIHHFQINIASFS